PSRWQLRTYATSSGGRLKSGQEWQVSARLGRGGSHPGSGSASARLAIWSQGSQLTEFQTNSFHSAHQAIACGRNREALLVIGPRSSRTESPAGAPAAHQEPSTA